MKKRILCCLIGMVAICGCARSRSEGNEDIPLFIPPTLVATAINTPTITSITPIPAAIEKNCRAILSYVDDVTVPDGTVFSPGDEIVKTWRVENSGNCKWTTRYSLRHQSGSAMGATGKMDLPIIPPGEEGIITITFTAPEYIGSYYSSWMAYDDQGRPFGDDIYMEIYVDPYRTPDPTATPDPAEEIPVTLITAESSSAEQAEQEETEIGQ